MSAQGDPISGRVPLMANDDVILSRCRPNQAQAELYRNADADEVLFIHRGHGMLHTMFGPLPVRPFDYVVIPRCTTYRLDFDPPNSSPSQGGDQGGVDLLVVEGTGNIGIPPHYSRGLAPHWRTRPSRYRRRACRWP